MASSPSESVALEKEACLRGLLDAKRPLAIAYSGGVDSAYLLAVAVEVCGDDALGVIADSASLPRQALQDAVDLANQLGARLEILSTEELDNPEYAANPLNRCYFCKSELFQKMDQLAASNGLLAIAYGENADDVRQLRPGSVAAKEFSVLVPLRDAGLTKAEIRLLSRLRNLPTADVPAQPCLSSRIPHGTPVTRAALKLVEAGEAFLKKQGFRVVRVRYLDGEGDAFPAARVLVSPEELSRLQSLAERIELGLMEVGFRRVEMDPQGYHSPPEILVQT